MKKSFCLIIIFILMFLFTSCNFNSDLGAGSTIVSPSNKSTPIVGEWKVKEVRNQEGTKLSSDKTWDNTTASFSTTIATFGNNYCKKPIYKTKVVDADSYLSITFKETPAHLSIKQKELEIITITSDNNFFYEFIKITDNCIITNIDGVFLYLYRTSKKTSTTGSLSTKLSTMEDSSIDSSKSKKSGVLIGLRSVKKSINSNEPLFAKDFSYRTLWVCYRDKKLDPVLETPNIFLPRMSGFWNLKSQRISNVDYLTTFPSGTESPKLATLPNSIMESKVIDFIGNDYISIEKTIKINDSPKSAPSYNSFLQVLPLDNLNSKESIKITQLTTVTGGIAFKERAASLINSLNDKTNLQKNLQEDNWGVFRRNGHWILKGRVSSPYSDIKSTRDFFIPIATPKILITYDDLTPSWSSIKERVPDAIDAFSSPNKDVLITISNTILSVYQLNNNSISTLPLAQVKLKEGETLIMDHWAVGDYYTDAWTKSFNKNPVTPATMVKKNN